MRILRYLVSFPRVGTKRINGVFGCILLDVNISCQNCFTKHSNVLRNMSIIMFTITICSVVVVVVVLFSHVIIIIKATMP